MLARKLPTVVFLALGVLGITTVALAQSDGGQEKEKEKSFFDRVDDLGKSIFSPLFSDDKPKQKDPATPTAEPRPSTRASTATAPAADPGIPPASGGRAGSILSGSAPAQRTMTGTRPATNPDASDNNMPPAVPGAADGTARVIQRAPADRSLLGDADTSAEAGTATACRVAAPTHDRSVGIARQSERESDRQQDVAAAVATAAPAIVVTPPVPIWGR